MGRCPLADAHARADSVLRVVFTSINHQISKFLIMSAAQEIVTTTWMTNFTDHTGSKIEEACLETIANMKYEPTQTESFPSSLSSTPPSSRSPASSPALLPPKSRTQPRKRPAILAPQPAPRIDYLASLKLFPTCPPTEFPSTPNFTYVLAEGDRNAPGFDEWEANPSARPFTAGNLFRVFMEDRPILSAQHQAPQLKVSLDRLTVTGDKGYSGARANVGVRGGRYYYEFTVKDMPGNSAIRAGWGTPRAVLQAPLGYDKFGYSWRSRKGTIFHESRGKHYSSGYGVGDVLGCYIELPFDKVEQLLPETYKDEPLVKYKTYFYYEVKDDVAKEVATLRPNKGSKIMFFKNGVCCGIAFSDVYAGTYHPIVSIYKNACVTLNFGPSFAHPPAGLTYLPISERIVEGAVEQTMADILFSIPNDPGPASKKRKAKH